MTKFKNKNNHHFILTDTEFGVNGHKSKNIIEIGVEADGMSTGAGTSRWSGSSSLVIGVRFRRSGPLKES